MPKINLEKVASAAMGEIMVAAAIATEILMLDKLDVNRNPEYVPLAFAACLYIGMKGVYIFAEANEK